MTIVQKTSAFGPEMQDEAQGQQDLAEELVMQADRKSAKQKGIGIVSDCAT